MTITTTANGPSPHFGPGIEMHSVTDVVTGAFPPNTQWVFTLTDHLSEALIQTVSREFSVPAINWQPFDPFLDSTHVQINPQAEGASTDISAQIVTPDDEVLDSGVATFDWSTTEGIPNVISNFTRANAQGVALNDTQAAQLANSSDNSDTNLSLWETFTSVTLPSLNDLINTIITGITATVHTPSADVPTPLAAFFELFTRETLTQSEVTSGPTCESINADISGVTVFSIVLAITSYPDNWFFGGPGQTWGPMDLAVLRVVRGENEVFRTGVHTTSYTLAPPPDVIINSLTFNIPITPPDYHILVDPAPGVCFQLFVENAP